MASPQPRPSKMIRLSAPHAPILELPLETAVVQRYACVGQTGSGKSSAAQCIAEDFLAAGVQIVVIDITGTWRGLRSMNGDSTKPSGLNVVIIGGLSGDKQLDPQKGGEYARWVVGEHPSVIFDLKGIRPGAREHFVEDFMRELYHQKGVAKIRTPLHIFFEEGHRWAAQQPDGREEKAVAYLMREIAEQIRNDGVGLTFITTAPQAIDKRVLNLTEVLFIFQTNGTHERKAVIEWAQSKHMKIEHTDLTEGLEIGECIVWSPRWLKTMTKTKIREKRTFYAGSTLKFGEAMVNVVPPLPADALSKLDAQLAVASKEVEENDPKMLRALNIKLKRELAAAQEKVPLPSERVVEERIVEKPIIAPGDMATITQALAKLAVLNESVNLLKKEVDDKIEVLTDEARTLLAKMEGIKHAVITTSEAERVAKKPAHQHWAQPQHPMPPQVTITIKEPKHIVGYQLTGKSRDMLYYVVATGDEGILPSELGVWTVMSRSGGSWRTYLSSLRSQGLINDDSDGRIRATANGRAIYSAEKIRPSRPQTSDLLQLWLPKVTGKAKDMLKALVERYPRGFTPDELAEHIEMSRDGGSWRTYLSSLRSNGLLFDSHDGRLFASVELFPEGK